MKYLILTILALSLFAGTAYAANDARFDWVLGQPAVMEDPTSTCTDTATIRYDWVLGQPAPVFNATANCTAVVGPSAPGGAKDDMWFFD